jgi:hypothetical protein
MTGKGRFSKKAQVKGKLQATGGSNNASHTNMRSINDYNYYLRSAKQASVYETTTEYLINYIKKVFNYVNDIGIMLKLFEPMNTAAWKQAKNEAELCTNRQRMHCRESPILNQV